MTGKIHPSQQKAELFRTDWQRRLFKKMSRPPVAILFQSFAPDSKPCVVPVKKTDNISAPVGKHKKRFAKYASLHLVFDDGAKTVSVFAHVDGEPIEKNVGEVINGFQLLTSKPLLATHDPQGNRSRLRSIVGLSLAAEFPA